jgi:uncharacterized protein
MDRISATRRLHQLLPAVALVTVGLMHLSCASTMELPPVVGTATPQPHLPGKFVWHALFTADVASARKFYGELLGWQFESPDGAEHYSIICSGGMPIGAMVEVKPEAGVRVDQWISFLSVEDVDRAAERFAASGRLYRGPLDLPEFGRVAVVADPQGAPLAIMRSTSGDPPDGVEPRIGEWIWRDYVSTAPDSAFRFYADLVGWEAHPIGRESGHGSRIRSAEARREYWLIGRDELSLWRAGAFRSPWTGVKPNWLTYVRVDDVVASAEKAKALGASIVLEPMQEVRHASTAIIADPRGAVLGLQRYPF